MALFNNQLILASVAFASDSYGDLITGVYEGGAEHLLHNSTSLSLILIAFGILLLLHFCFFVFNLLNSSSVSNLFLSVQYVLPNISESLLTGYLRVLDRHSATIISSREIQRGEAIKVNFGSLVNFSQHSDSYISGSVRSCRKLSGNPVSYITKVSFDDLDQKLSESLDVYLLSLKKKK